MRRALPPDALRAVVVGRLSPPGPVPEGQHPPAVIVLTTFDTDEHVLRALRVGASGFVLKDTPPAEIVRAVRGSPPESRSCRRR